MKQWLWWSRPRGVEVLPGGAAELGAADDQRVVEQAALFEVFDERGQRLVELPRQLAVVVDVGVAVPVVVRADVEQLDDPHAPLDQPAGDQALGGERRPVAGRCAIKRQRVRRLAADVKRLGCLAHQSVGRVDRRQA